MSFSYLEFWYQALNSPGGIVIRTNNPPLFRQNAYKARREAHDPQLMLLSLCHSPTDPNELWVVHRELPEDQDAPQTNLARPEKGHDELPSIELPPDV